MSSTVKRTMADVPRPTLSVHSQCTRTQPLPRIRDSTTKRTLSVIMMKLKLLVRALSVNPQERRAMNWLQSTIPSQEHSREHPRRGHVHCPSCPDPNGEVYSDASQLSPKLIGRMTTATQRNGASRRQLQPPRLEHQWARPFSTVRTPSASVSRSLLVVGPPFGRGICH